MSRSAGDGRDGVMTVVSGLLGELAEVGAHPGGGYVRSAWSSADLEARQWFVQCADALDLDVETDRNGNLWAWWRADAPGSALVVGSHLDSVPGGGAFDGPLGVASGFAAIARLRRDGFVPVRPVAVVAFVDAEGERFGVAHVGSRLLTGLLRPEHARSSRDDAGVSMAEAMAGAGVDARHLGRDDERLARIGEFVELHVEQGHLPVGATGAEGLAAAGSPLGVVDATRPHGRWRIDVPGRPGHSWAAPMAARRDPLTGAAHIVLAVRTAAVAHGAVATVARLRVSPGASGVIAGEASVGIDVAADDERIVRRVLSDVRRATGFDPVEEWWSPQARFDSAFVDAVGTGLGGLPVLPAAAGHDAGVLSSAGITATMLLVRNATGASHTAEEHVDDADCEAGVDALATLIRSRG